MRRPWEPGAAGDSSGHPSVWGAAEDLVIPSGEAAAWEKARGAKEVFISGKADSPVHFFCLSNGHHCSFGSVAL